MFGIAVFQSNCLECAFQFKWVESALLSKWVESVFQSKWVESVFQSMWAASVIPNQADGNCIPNQVEYLHSSPSGRNLSIAVCVLNICIPEFQVNVAGISISPSVMSASSLAGSDMRPG